MKKLNVEVLESNIDVLEVTENLSLVSGNYVSLIMDETCYVYVELEIEDNQADITIAVTEPSIDAVKKAIEGMMNCEYEITGTGSIKGLRLAKQYILGELKQWCINHGLESICWYAADEKRASAYRFMKRYGFTQITNNKMAYPLNSVGESRIEEEVKLWNS